MDEIVCKYSNCTGEVFAACSFTSCRGKGPAFCHENFINGSSQSAQQSHVIGAAVLMKAILQNSITNVIAVSDRLATKEAFMSAVMPTAKKANFFLLMAEDKAAIIA